MNIEERVIRIVSNACSNNEITSQSTQSNTEDWDSLAYLVVISEVEREFSFTVDEIAFDKFTSVSSIVKVIERNLLK